jgi:hypothetical protein
MSYYYPPFTLFMAKIGLFIIEPMAIQFFNGSIARMSTELKIDWATPALKMLTTSLICCALSLAQ